MAGTSVRSQRVYLHAITYLARDTCAFEFRAVNGGALAPFTAGAHVDLMLPNGIRRSYSLCNPQGETHRYVVGVKRASPSRGASAYLHDHLRVGTEIDVAEPRNNFPLIESAPHSVLIAGGIGVTPIYGMLQRLAGTGASWELHYACRTRADGAFLDELQALGARDPVRVRLSFDHEPGGKMLDLAAIVGAAPAQSHFYACGPAPMLEAFETATGALAPEQRHIERFTAGDDVVRTGDVGFEIVLARSNTRLQVPPGKPILDVLLDEGIEIAFSCMEGVCGSCEVAVLDGVPDHRDVVLSAEERAANKTMLVCCSGARSERLVLDL
jgi:vanillate O-demethylase ferredoxin subunit